MNYTDLRQAFYKFEKIDNKGINFIDFKGIEKYVPYSKIYINVLKIADFLKKNNIKQCTKIVFQIDSVELFVYSFWACIVNEYYAIPLEIIKNKESKNKLINVCNNIKDKIIITTKNKYNGLLKIKDNVKCEILVIDNYEDIIIDKNKVIKKTDSIADKTAFIQFSSGSTGNPKGVILSHNNLISNIDAIQKGILLKENDIGLSWLPLTHDMGLIGFHLTPALKGINHIIIETKAFVYNPAIWLKAIKKYKATITCSPNFGYKFLLSYLKKKKLDEDFDLSSVRVIFNGAEPISYDIISLFMNEMVKYNLKSNVIFPVYGLAEGTLAVAFPSVGDKVKYLSVSKGNLSIGDKIKFDGNGLKIVCEGKVVKGVKVSLLNNNNEEVSNCQVGKIYIYGKNVSKNYLINNEKVYSLDDKDRLYTGDIGFIYEDELYIIGRESELIINGKNYFCTDAEEFIYEKLKFKYKFVIIPVKVKDEYKVFVFIKHVFNDKVVAIFSSLREEIYKETSIFIDGIIFVDSIPKTTSGKIKRYQLTEEFYNGKYTDIVYFNEFCESKKYNELENVILNLFENSYGERPDINKDVSYLFNESLNNIIFLVSIEDEYKIKLNFDDFMNLNTIKEICNKVEKYLS